MNYFLNNGEFTYSRLMLFSWESDSNMSSFSETNGNFLTQKLEGYLEHVETSLLVLNCNHVVDVDDHFFSSLLKFYETNNVTILFYSDDTEGVLISYFDEHLDQDKYRKTTSSRKEGTKFYCLYKNELCESTWVSIKKKAKTLEKNQIQNQIKSSYTPNSDNTTLFSTPLIASGHFNASELISEPSCFRWLVLLMVEKIYDIIINNRIKRCTIVASSLRGAAIAGSVKEILHYMFNIDFYVFDHIGPKHDFVIKPMNFNFANSECCFYVGDFLIAGTELKLTQAYCNFFGGAINHAFILGKYTKANNLDSNVTLHSLVQLQDCVPELTYEVF